MSTALRLPGVRHPDHQVVLWPGLADPQSKSLAAIRTWIGDAAEELVAGLTGGTRLLTDAHADICPDIQVGPDRFLEVKALRRGGELIVFAARLQRDAQLERVGASLTYCLVVHAVDTSGLTSRDAARAAVATTALEVLTIPAAVIRRLCRRRKAVLLDYHGTDDEKTAAYRLPWGLLHQLAGKASAIYPPVSVYGHETGALVVTGGHRARIFAPFSALIREAAGYLHEELRNTRLDVVLVTAPSPRHLGHCVRISQQCNPAWYRSLCAAVESGRSDRQRYRKFKTAIKRRETLKALRAIADGKRPPYHLGLLIAAIEAEIAAWSDPEAHR